MGEQMWTLSFLFHVILYYIICTRIWYTLAMCSANFREWNVNIYESLNYNKNENDGMKDENQSFN